MHVASYHGEIDPITATDLPLIGYRASAAQSLLHYSLPNQRHTSCCCEGSEDVQGARDAAYRRVTSW